MASGAVIGNTQLVKTAKQVEVDMGDEAVPLAEQDGFEHGQKGRGVAAAAASEITGPLTIQLLFDRLPVNHFLQLQEREAVDVFDNHDLCGLPEEGTREKSPRCPDGNLGDFLGGNFAKVSGRLKTYFRRPALYD